MPCLCSLDVHIGFVGLILGRLRSEAHPSLLTGPRALPAVSETCGWSPAHSLGPSAHLPPPPSWRGAVVPHGFSVYKVAEPLSRPVLFETLFHSPSWPDPGMFYRETARRVHWWADPHFGKCPSLHPAWFAFCCAIQMLYDLRHGKSCYIYKLAKIGKVTFSFFPHTFSIPPYFCIFFIFI